MIIDGVYLEDVCKENVLSLGFLHGLCVPFLSIAEVREAILFVKSQLSESYEINVCASEVSVFGLNSFLLYINYILKLILRCLVNNYTRNTSAYDCTSKNLEADLTCI